MAGNLGKFQTTTAEGWMGLTKKNHLAAAFGDSPQKVSDVMIQLLANKRGNTLETFLNKFPVKEFDSDDEITWKVEGSAKKNVALVEARKFDGTIVENSNELIGVGVEPFFLVFAEEYFADGEVIFGHLNQLYPIRILGVPRVEGTNVVYKVELMGGNTTGMPSERLLPGERFSVGFAPVERELSRKAGDVRFASSVSMRNEWTSIRIQHKVPGSMLNKKLKMKLPVIVNRNGKSERKVADLWMHYVDWTVEEQWSDYKNLALAWGTSNRTADNTYLNFGKSGEVIRMGDGLFAQLEVGNTQYYNKFSLKHLENILMDISGGGKIDFQNRVFILRTGERGATQFHKEVMNTVSGWTVFNMAGTDVGAIAKTTSPLHKNALRAGFQFTEYLAPNGVIIKLEIDPFYDDPVHHKIMHPLGGPAFSYRYDILDMGDMNEPNVQLCRIKGEPETRSIVSGIRNPFTGQASVEYAANDEDAATIHKFITFGVIVMDPTRTMSLIPSILQG